MLTMRTLQTTLIKEHAEKQIQELEQRKNHYKICDSFPFKQTDWFTEDHKTTILDRGPNDKYRYCPYCGLSLTDLK